MVRSLLITLALFLFVGSAVAQTVLTGTVKDAKGEDLIGASIKVLKGSELVKGAITDYEGKFRISIDPGTYDLEISYTGYTTSRTTGVQVLANKLNSIDDITLADGLVQFLVAYAILPLVSRQGGGAQHGPWGAVAAASRTVARDAVLLPRELNEARSCRRGR